MEPFVQNLGNVAIISTDSSFMVFLKFVQYNSMERMFSVLSNDFEIYSSLLHHAMLVLNVHRGL